MEKYEVISNDSKEDGAYMISVNAPDIIDIVKKTYAENGELGTVDVSKMEQLIKEDDTEPKQYIFSVEALDDKTIQEAFFNQIVYELVISSIENLEIQTSEEEAQQ